MQLATGYAPLLIQMYATTIFQFQQGDNGWLMSGWACIRAMFLIFAFPQIISYGRTWYMARYPRPNETLGDDEGSEQVTPVAELPTHPEELEAPIGSLAEEEPIAAKPTKEDGGTGFDLFFLRWSLVLDGLLTAVAAFATKKWHIFLGKSPSWSSIQVSSLS